MCICILHPTPHPPPLPVESPTLVDDEAVLGEIVPGEYPLISPQHEQNLGRVLSDVVYTRFVSEIKGRHLTGHLKKETRVSCEMFPEEYTVNCYLPVDAFATTFFFLAFIPTSKSFKIGQNKNNSKVIKV